MSGGELAYGMRRFVPLFAVILAGCGGSAAGPSATATPGTRTGGVAVHTRRVVSAGDHAFLQMSLRNNGTTGFQPSGPAPLTNVAFSDPTKPGTPGPCDADSTRGPALQDQSIPAHGTRSGWIRCDYPRGTRILVLLWQNVEVGGYHV